MVYLAAGEANDERGIIMTVKLAVIYYSSTGTNYRLAQWAREGVVSSAVQPAEVRVLKVPELAPQQAIDSNPAWKRHAEETRDVPVATLADLDWADAYIFSSPSRYGQMASQLKQFLDTTGGMWARGQLAHKVVSAMTSAQNTHGGQESTILSIYAAVHTWGAIVAAPGANHPSMAAVGGNPFGVSVTVKRFDELAPAIEEAVKYQARRTVAIAQWVKRGLKEKMDGV